MTNGRIMNFDDEQLKKTISGLNNMVEEFEILHNNLGEIVKANAQFVRNLKRLMYGQSDINKGCKLAEIDNWPCTHSESGSCPVACTHYVPIISPILKNNMTGTKGIDCPKCHRENSPFAERCHYCAFKLKEDK